MLVWGFRFISNSAVCREKLCSCRAEVKLCRLLGGFTCTRDCPGISRCWQLAVVPSPLEASG